MFGYLFFFARLDILLSGWIFWVFAVVGNFFGFCSGWKRNADSGKCVGGEQSAPSCKSFRQKVESAKFTSVYSNSHRLLFTGSTRPTQINEAVQCKPKSMRLYNVNVISTDIFGTKRATGDPRVSKRPYFLQLFRFPKRN